MTDTFSLSTIPVKLLAVILIALTGYVTVEVVCFREGMIPLLFELCLFGVLIGFAQLKLANLVLAFVLSDHLCQFLKRMIFAIGPQSRMVYYGFQLMPAVILFIAGITALYTISKQKIPPSTKVLMGYIMVSILVSFLNVRAMSLQAGVAGVVGLMITLFALLAGMALPLTIFKRFSKLLVTLIVVSVVYGFYQFYFGPTIFDRAWADACKDFSIEAFKVYNAIYYTGSEFRPYSYYNDHTTWGFFLCTSAIALLAMTSIKAIPRKVVYFAVPVAMFGMVLCETRVPWLGFLGALVTYRFITTRALRRPMLLILGVISFFGVVVGFGEFALQHFSFAGSSHLLVNRFTTVGTLEARTSAWRLFVRNIPSHWLLGTGFGYASSDPSVSLAEEVYSHNVFVELLVLTGLPGLFLFLAFFYTWMKEAFWVAQVSTGAVAKLTLWIIALVTGMMLTGSIQGSLFMTTYLCLFMGIVSGEWARLQKVPVVAPLRFPRAATPEQLVAALQR